MKILIINGPNINFVGIRETDLYGTMSYQKMNELILEKYPFIEIKQSNHEGDLIDYLQNAYLNHYDGVIINPGGYTHTSIAIMDAIKAINPLPVVEVHLTDIDTRERYRQISYPSLVCIKTFKGKKVDSYLEAIEYLINYQG